MNGDPQGEPERPAPSASSGLYALCHSPRTRYLAFSASRREARAWFRERVLRDRANPKTAGSGKKPEAVIQPTAEGSSSGHPQALANPLHADSSGENSPIDRVEAQSPTSGFVENPPQPKRTEQTAARWAALRNLLGDPPELAGHGAESALPRIPAVLLFSVAGGVGKSTIASTLARALASHGERVLLVDATSTGILPLAFGARERKRGVLRTFAPPAGSAEAHVQTITVDSAEPWGPDTFEAEALFDLLLKQPAHPDRILIDVPTASKGTALRLLPLAPLILVPLLPDIHSAAALDSIEAFFAAWMDEERMAGPYYLLNQFDPDLPRHAFEREALRARLGNRLIDFELRRDPAVTDALAEGMTVIDFAPTSEAAADHRKLAEWLRAVSPPASSLSSRRWTEQ